MQRLCFNRHKTNVSASIQIDSTHRVNTHFIKKRNTSVFVGEVSYLGVEELADSQVVLKFKADVDEKNIFSGRRLLNKEIKCAFDRAGLEIPFPQIDVHNK